MLFRIFFQNDFKTKFSTIVEKKWKLLIMKQNLKRDKFKHDIQIICLSFLIRYNYHMEYCHIIYNGYAIAFIISFVKRFDPKIYLKFHIISIILSYDSIFRSDKINLSIKYLWK